jgi:hypothetical protein
MKKYVHLVSVLILFIAFDARAEGQISSKDKYRWGSTVCDKAEKGSMGTSVATRSVVGSKASRASKAN